MAEQIAAFEEAAGTDIHFIARLYWPGLDRSVQSEAIRIFGERVIPAVRTRAAAVR